LEEYLDISIDDQWEFHGKFAGYFGSLILMILRDQVPKEAHRGWKSTVIQVVFGLIKLVNNLDVASTDGYRLYKAKH